MQRIITCPHCGIQFTGSHPRRTYCSDACRNAAYRDRMAQAGCMLDSRTWNGVEIQRRPSDGFVHATAMCKAYGKRWENYHRNDRTQQYIAALERSMAETHCAAAVTRNRATGKPPLVQIIQGGPPHLQCTWVHPRIAVDLARWLHPEFAVMMDGWFLESFTPKITGAQGRAAQHLPAKSAPRRRMARASVPTQITWGDRAALAGIAWHARQIDKEIGKILRSGVLSE